MNELNHKKTSVGFSKKRINKLSSKKVDSSNNFQMSSKTLLTLKGMSIVSKSYRIASNFLDKFTIYSMGEQQTLNLELMLYSIPKKIG